MPNLIDVNGLQTKTFDELYDELSVKLKAIYGDDINLEPDSPDGQALGIYVQAQLDLMDLLVQINVGIDPDQAIGRILDQRVALNGIQRKAGTFTRTPIQVTIDRALTLAGLDGDIDNPDGTGYTVADNAGTQWILEETQSPGAAGSYSYMFRAKSVGANQTVPNTITVPVTVIIGVVSVNNPTTYTTLGLSEELDSELRERRRSSVSIAGQGWRDSLKAALNNLNGVTFEEVYENTDADVDADGIPGHGIWVIVDGGTPSEIANVIYRKRNAGASMKGDEVVTITQRDGSLFDIKYDVVVNEDLWIQITVSAIDDDDVIDVDAIKDGIVEKLTPGVYDTVNITELGTIVQEIDQNAYIVPTVGDGFALTEPGPYTNTLTPSAKNKRFVVSADRIEVVVI